MKYIVMPCVGTLALVCVGGFTVLGEWVPFDKYPPMEYESKPAYIEITSNQIYSPSATLKDEDTWKWSDNETNQTRLVNEGTTITWDIKGGTVIGVPNWSFVGGTRKVVLTVQGPELKPTGVVEDKVDKFFYKDTGNALMKDADQFSMNTVRWKYISAIAVEEIAPL